MLKRINLTILEPSNTVTRFVLVVSAKPKNKILSSPPLKETIPPALMNQNPKNTISSVVFSTQEKFVLKS